MPFLTDAVQWGGVYLLGIFVLLVFKTLTVFKEIYFCTYLLQAILYVFTCINYFFMGYLT